MVGKALPGCIYHLFFLLFTYFFHIFAFLVSLGIWYRADMGLHHYSVDATHGGQLDMPANCTIPERKSHLNFQRAVPCRLISPS